VARKVYQRVLKNRVAHTDVGNAHLLLEIFARVKNFGRDPDSIYSIIRFMDAPTILHHEEISPVARLRLVQIIQHLIRWRLGHGSLDRNRKNIIEGDLKFYQGWHKTILKKIRPAIQRKSPSASTSSRHQNPADGLNKTSRLTAGKKLKRPLNHSATKRNEGRARSTFAHLFSPTKRDSVRVSRHSSRPTDRPRAIGRSI
jgi:hypothetical protein